MKTVRILTLLVAVVVIIPAANAQIETPRPSPGAEVEQMIGLTEVELDYSRPGVKGRTIFGELVPFGQMWRTGANQVTTISFSTKVQIQGADLEAGEYAMLTTPGESEWTFHFYPKEENTWSDYIEKEAALEVTASSIHTGMPIESMLFYFDHVKDGSASLGLLWENTGVMLEIVAPTAELVESKIAEVMAGPSERDYWDAAEYYLQSNKELETALEYIQKVTSVEDPNMWAVRTEAEIYAAMGNYKEAIKAAERSNAAAAASDSRWVDYITNMNNESIEEWKAAK